MGRVAKEKIARVAWVPFAIAAAWIARAAITRVLAKVGHAGATLDDAYIHFQYARAIAEGHPLRYQAGAPATSGATSFAWPLVLAPFWLVGFRGEAIVWIAWTASFAALAALAHEARLLARGLAGEAAGFGAAAMVLAFPAFAWFAASGMEVVPFAWVLARCARRAAEWSEIDRAKRSRGRAWELVALAIAAPLVRPEAGIASIAIAIVLARDPIEASHARSPWIARAFPIAALAGAALPSLVLLLATGEARSATAIVKLLPGNPYYRGGALVAQIAMQARFFVSSILDGGPYSAEFVPTGGAAMACTGLVAIAIVGARAKKTTRAALVIGLALMALVPCAYVTFLWNRVRYVWPFATGWIVGLACLARLAGDAAATVWPRARLLAPIACGVVAGLFFTRMDGALDDVAQSASGIDRQQATLGRWAKDALPRDARIGVNDTGAIAYFGERRTFDVVGLTTRGEARYWVAGAGSRLEHYERLHARDPDLLPTHFIVYPEWLGCDAILGAPLHEATVRDATILGGQTMRAYVADYALLGSGEAPWSSHGAIVDAIDVADLESEALHEYALLDARDGEEIAGSAPCGCEDGHPLIDGARTRRTRDTFVAHVPSHASRLIARVASSAPAIVTASIDGHTIGARPVDPGTWSEMAFDVPASDRDRDRARVEILAAGGELTSFHYWITDAITARD